MEDDHTQDVRRPHLKWKTTSSKMEDNLTQNGILPHPKWKTTSPKMEDDLIQNRRGRHSKWKTTSPKIEDDQKIRHINCTTPNSVDTVTNRLVLLKPLGEL